MSGLSSPPPDEARISTTAALAALGGHAIVVLAVLLAGARTPTVIATSNVVAVTLVNGAPGGSVSSAPAAPAAAPATSNPISKAPAPGDLAGERLDRLFAPDAVTRAAASPPRTRPSAGGGRSSADNARATGSSRAGQGLGLGEGAEGVDLYAAASLPNVGIRPASPPVGDLWDRVAPCWRSAAPRKATLMVEISDDGRIAGSPRAVRKLVAPADPQLLLAERAGARALQACAPYAGLSGRTWRVEFP